MKNILKAFSAAIMLGMVMIGISGWYQGLSQPAYTTVVSGSSAIVSGSTALANVTGISFPVAANQQYTGVCYVTRQSTVGTAGPVYAFTGPASVTAAQIGMHSPVTATTSQYVSALGIGSANSLSNTGSVTTSTNFTDIVQVGLNNGSAAGTLQLQFAADGTGSISIEPGSFCKWQ